MAESTTLFHSSTESQKTSQTCTKFSSSFFHRGFLFVLLIALLPLLPSEAPEFLNQSIPSTSWELLRLLFVGIVISYGLFCRRCAETYTQNEKPCKPESPQSYISEYLNVSSVFNDDDEIHSPRADEAVDDSDFQTWNSQYQRKESLVVVKDEVTDHSTNKPLLLPVRSLKSSAQDAASSSNYVNQLMNSTDYYKESVVFRSPIPWSSRAGRMETKEESELNKGMAPPPPVLNVDTGTVKSSAYRSAALPNLSTTGSQSSQSSSLEMRAKFSEDMAKKKSFKASSLPVPPPPPPPPPIHGYHAIFDKKVTTKSFKDELKDLSRRGRENLQAYSDHVLDLPNSSATKPRNNCDGLSKSVRTVRSNSEKSMSYDTQIPTKHQNEKINEYFGKIVVSSDDSDIEDSDHGHGSRVHEETSCKEEVSKTKLKAETAENEVDKKADEFIAKFREQIRLQRIDSIKRSTKQRIAKKQP